MKPHDYTDMGGASEAFLTTHWSLIDDIKSKKDEKQALTGLLLDRYWKPVYCYLRRKGYDNEKAKDLTQSFFHEVVLNRNLLQRTEQCKGRFRSFLLHALNQYLIDCKRRQGAFKHIPKDKLVPLEIIEPPILPQTISNLGPEESFNYAWKSTLLDRILTQVQVKCSEEGMSIHWKIFNDRIVQPILENIEAPSLKEICSKYAIENEVKASNMAITVKRRFQSALKKYIRSTVISEIQIDEELKDILKLFSKKAQDSK
jgi:RNA polymerase sigma-70 factor (ECF subfamily)